MKKEDKIYVAGHLGMAGSAIVRLLKAEGFDNLVFKPHKELDLTHQSDVNDYFSDEKPKYVFMAAAKVGGILANNNYPADFIYQNLMMATNIVHSAYRFNVDRVQFLSSTCAYPRDCHQPIKEDYLLTGALEKTNEAYAMAKIAGMKLCEFYRRQYGCDYFSVMPTNLYGPGDNFNLETSHVLPALMAKIHCAKMHNNNEVTVWGDGTPLREFLHVDDLAKACIYLMMQERVHYDVVNIGSGHEVSIAQLAQLISRIIGYDNAIVFDKSKPNGTPRKLSDNTRMTELGWKATISLEKGIESTYLWYQQNH